MAVRDQHPRGFGKLKVGAGAAADYFVHKFRELYAEKEPLRLEVEVLEQNVKNNALIQKVFEIWRA